MDDKELPGFKINDYSGDGNDGTEEAGHTESLVATGDAQSGGDSVAGGSAENSPVTHGEGEIKPVMVENEQVGGAEEKAPKTASEGLGEHFEDLGGVSNGLKSDAKIEGPTQVTEAEARAMLIEDNARAKEALKKANSRGKKTLVAVIVVAVLLVVAGVATSIILSGMRKSEGNDGEQEGNGGNTSVVEKPEESPDELEAVELSLDDELVQELYGQFEISPLQGFYEDELSAGVSGDNREHGRLEMALNQAENWTGAAVQAKFQKMFGKAIELAEEKYGVAWGDEQLVAIGAKFVIYDGQKDEFLELEGGTDAAGRYVRRLERAEKDGGKIYLYERVLTINCRPDPRFDEEGNQIGNGSSCGVLTVAVTCGTPEFGWSGDEEGMTDEEVLNEAAVKRFGVVRWVFEKNAEGNYVFKGLERVIEGEEGEEIVETIEEREQRIKEANA